MKHETRLKASKLLIFTTIRALWDGEAQACPLTTRRLTANNSTERLDESLMLYEKAGLGCFTSRVAFNGKLERCISLSFAASINFSIFLRSDIFLCLLFILCCFRCLPRSEQDIFNSFRAEGKRWKSKSRSGEWEKCFTNWIENLCYKIYFTISRLKNLASTRKILKECLIAYKQKERSPLNYNSTKPQTAENINFISNWHLMLTDLARRQDWFDIGADENIFRALQASIYRKTF